MKYQVGGAVHASTFIGEFEADSPEAAIELAYQQAHISVCHQCARDIQDPEVAQLWAEDNEGNVTRESEPVTNANQTVLTFRNAAEKRSFLKRLMECNDLADVVYGWSDPEGQEPWEVDEIEVEVDGG